ncbi:MAG: hypothetical protein AAB353_03795, partial [Candidatus Hydrogenedentota bacterium]
RTPEQLIEEVSVSKQYEEAISILRFRNWKYVFGLLYFRVILETFLPIGMSIFAVCSVFYYLYNN